MKKIKEGILLVNKPKGRTSFSLVAQLRKKLGVKKIGHAGTLDPFATGVMVMLVGREYTRLSDQFLTQDKEYRAQILLGIATDTYDCDGKITFQSEEIPSKEEILNSLNSFQDEIEQIPPMYSAKKVNGKKLYELARQGKTIVRKPVQIKLKTQLINYDYPHLNIHVTCSKGTYIRSIAEDIGKMLGCGAHLKNLERIRSGQFYINECVDGEMIDNPEFDLKSYFKQ